MASGSQNMTTYKAKQLVNTYGSDTKPVYINAGVPTILGTIGGQYNPVWFNSGVITAITAGTTGQFYRGDKTWSNTLVGAFTCNSTLTVNAENSTTEGGQICLKADPNHSAYHAYLDVCNNYFRVHSNGEERISVELASNGVTNIRGKLIVNQPNEHRDNGIYGTYIYTKAATIWSMGTAYKIAADGSGLGSLYGAAYAYQDQAYIGSKRLAGGHQFLWCQNGGVNVALGSNIWTSGSLYITGADHGIYYDGSKSTNRMIRFTDNTAGTDGNGIIIGGAGYVGIGSGESGDQTYSGAGYAAGSEVLALSSDGDIRLLPNQQNGYNVVSETLITTSGLWVGVAGNTTREMDIGVRSGAGTMYMWAAASTTGDRGIWLPAHGSGGAKAVFTVNTNNAVTFNGTLNGNANTATTATNLSGGTVSLKANQYQTDSKYGLNANNSDIIGLNRLQWADKADAFNEGIMFVNGSSGYDCMAAAGGNFFFRSATDGTPGLSAANATAGIYAANFYGYFNGNVSGSSGSCRGNSATATSSTYSRYLTCPDTRNSNPAPGDFTATTTGFSCDFKTGSVIGLTSASYSGVITFRPYASGQDWSGGNAHQIACNNAGLYWRNGGSSWGSWKRIWVEGDNFTISHATSADMAYNSANPKITFSESGGQPVVLVYTDYDSYRAPAGLKVTGNQGGEWFEVAGHIYAAAVHNAIWNDYAECRKANCEEPGRVIAPQSNGTAYKTTRRLESGCRVISDTWGHIIGESTEAKTPVAVSGRVLAYPYRNPVEYKIGDCVCSAPNGTVDIMTREEIKEYPDRIIGIVNEIPTYSVWEQTEPDGERRTTRVEVKGRIWIDIK